MSDRRDDAMKHAVQLALSGRYSNWWSVSARMRATSYQESDVDWTQSQRRWLDLLCAEARRAVRDADTSRPSCA